MNKILFLTCLLSALLEIFLAIPLLLKRIPRNQFYGLRTSKTLSDDKYWYPANKRCGQGLALAGTVTLLISTLYNFRFYQEEHQTIAFLGIILLPMILAFLDSFLYLRKL